MSECKHVLTDADVLRTHKRCLFCGKTEREINLESRLQRLEAAVDAAKEFTEAFNAWTSVVLSRNGEDKRLKAAHANMIKTLAALDADNEPEREDTYFDRTERQL